MVGMTRGSVLRVASVLDQPHFGDTNGMAYVTQVLLVKLLCVLPWVKQQVQGREVALRCLDAKGRLVHDCHSINSV